MKIIRLDSRQSGNARGGHTEVEVETAEQAGAEIERMMNEAGYPATVLVEDPPGTDGRRAGSPAEAVAGASPAAQVWIIPQLVGG